MTAVAVVTIWVVGTMASRFAFRVLEPYLFNPDSEIDVSYTITLLSIVWFVAISVIISVNGISALTKLIDKGAEKCRNTLTRRIDPDHRIEAPKVMSRKTKEY